MKCQLTADDQRDFNSSVPQQKNETHYNRKNKSSRNKQESGLERDHWD